MPFVSLIDNESGSSSDISERSRPTTTLFTDTTILDVRHDETDGAQRFGDMPEIVKPILGFPESAMDQECARKWSVTLRETRRSMNCDGASP